MKTQVTRAKRNGTSAAKIPRGVAKFTSTVSELSSATADWKAILAWRAPNILYALGTLVGALAAKGFLGG